MPTLSWGSCPAGRRGSSHICHNLDFIGIDSEGSMQNAWNVPAEILIALPEGLALDEAALIEPTAVAVHDVRRSKLDASDFVVVIGGGPVGQLIASVALQQGARVVLVELDPGRRETAKGFGITAIDPREENLVDHVLQGTGGAGADVAFEVSGAATGVNSTVEVRRVRLERHHRCAAARRKRRVLRPHWSRFTRSTRTARDTCRGSHRPRHRRPGCADGPHAQGTPNPVDAEGELLPRGQREFQTHSRGSGFIAHHGSHDPPRQRHLACSLTSAARTINTAIEIARPAGVTVSFDLNYRANLSTTTDAGRSYRELIPLTDIVFAGDEEAALAVGPADNPAVLAQRLANLGPSQAVIKLGS